MSLISESLKEARPSGGAKPMAEATLGSGYRRLDSLHDFVSIAKSVLGKLVESRANDVTEATAAATENGRTLRTWMPTLWQTPFDNMVGNVTENQWKWSVANQVREWAHMHNISQDGEWVPIAFEVDSQVKDHSQVVSSHMDGDGEIVGLMPAAGGMTAESKRVRIADQKTYIRIAVKFIDVRGDDEVIYSGKGERLDGQAVGGANRELVELMRASLLANTTQAAESAAAEKSAKLESENNELRERLARLEQMVSGLGGYQPAAPAPAPVADDDADDGDDTDDVSDGHKAAPSIDSLKAASSRDEVADMLGGVDKNDIKAIFRKLTDKPPARRNTRTLIAGIADALFDSDSGL